VLRLFIQVPGLSEKKYERWGEVCKPPKGNCTHRQLNELAYAKAMLPGLDDLA